MSRGLTAPATSRLDELPDPKGRTGWPWTEAPAPLPSHRPDGREWPRITILTPSLNQGPFIEETIRSVILQGYPNVQHVVIDGGSTDETLEILHKYDRYVSYWVSEPDRGPSHGLNKGLSVADGEIVAWLSSDDHYLPGALEAVAAAFDVEGVNWASGSCRWRVEGEPEYVRQSFVDAPLCDWLVVNAVQMPASFWRRSLHDEAGGFDEAFHYMMDGELFLRFRLAGECPVPIDRELAVFRVHDKSKTGSAIPKFIRERVDHVVPRYLGQLPPRERLRARSRIARKHFFLAQTAFGEHLYGEAIRRLALALKWQPITLAAESARGLRGRLVRR